MADLVKYRDYLHIDPVGSVEVQFYAPGSVTDEAFAKYVCRSCGDWMSWVEERGLYECPLCGIELTAYEALTLLNHYRKLLSQLSHQVTHDRGIIWRFLRFLGVRLRAKPQPQD